jgi:hypothetical protein
VRRECERTAGGAKKRAVASPAGGKGKSSAAGGAAAAAAEVTPGPVTAEGTLELAGVRPRNYAPYYARFIRFEVDEAG